MADIEVELAVDLPPIDEQTRVLVVRCGLTVAEVKEHGRAGSGQWAAWTPEGHVIDGGGMNDYPYEQAVDDARTHVRREEASRLLHRALSERLSKEES